MWPRRASSPKSTGRASVRSERLVRSALLELARLARARRCGPRRWGAQAQGSRALRPRRSNEPSHTIDSAPHTGAAVMRRAVFLDRDGTLNVRPDEHAYVESLDGFVWLAGALEGASALARAGFVLAVVSNQRGVARGLVSWATLTSIEHEIQARMRDAGAEITAFRYCPHDLAATPDIALPRSWMIGDAESDIAAGQAAGCRTALIDEPGSPARSRRSQPDIVAPSLDAAATAILRRAEPEPLSPA